MTYWAFKKLFWLLWPLIPLFIRSRLTRRIQAVQKCCVSQVPVSDVEVVVYSEAAFYEASSWEGLSGVTLRREELRNILPQFSIIATCYNEASSIDGWLNSVSLLTTLPSEVVICDGGSTDQTVEKIRSWQIAHPDLYFSIKVISGKRRNIAEGRNEAARHASSEILLFSDVGTILHSEWATRLIAPFASNSKLNCVMGWYQAQEVDCSDFAIQLQSLFVPVLDEINPTTFLPSARSVAVKKELFWQVGGYPEQLTHAGEDTLFDILLKQAAASFAFVPEAYVFWQPPCDVEKTLRAVFSYSRGDAEAKLFWKHYIDQIEKVAAIALDFIFVVVISLVTTNKGLYFIALLLLCFAICSGVSLLKPYVARMRLRTSTIDLSQWILAAAFVLAQSLGFLRGIKGRSPVCGLSPQA